MLRSALGVVVILGGMTMVRVSHAEEGVAVKAAADDEPASRQEAESPVAVKAAAGDEAASRQEAESPGHASGLMVQARVQSQTSLLSLVGAGTGFLVGYQGPSYAIGLGLGLSRVGVSAGGESDSLTLFQVAPTAIIDVWHSADGRARANLIGSVGYARASFSGTVTSQDCTSDALGNESCTSNSQDATASATLIPVMVGFGGDYYLSRNFALGAEFGVQALFLASANTTSSGSSQTVDLGANAQFAYGALRATFVLGD